ncbi:hypothetical protein CHUAL_002848 [Chamberlinius hualienensis]
MDNNQFSSDLFSKIESIKKLLEEDSSIDKKAGEYLLLTSLHTCNGDVERTKEKIIKYFQYKKQFPKLLKAVDLLDDYRQSMYRKCILITDVNQEQLKSPFVVVIDMSKGSDVNVLDAVNCLINFINVSILHSERLRKHGLIAVINVGAMPFNLLFQFRPTFLYESIKCQLLVAGELLKKIITINAGMIMGATITVARQVLPSSLNEKVVVYSGSWDCLKDEIPSESLPIEYGGTNGTIEECNAQLMPIMTKWRDVILNQF